MVGWFGFNEAKLNTLNSQRAIKHISVQ